MKDRLEQVIKNENDERINLGDERAAEIYAHLIGTAQARFGANDTPEGIRRLAEAAVKKIFQNKQIPDEVKKLLDQKFPTNEYPMPKSTGEN